MDFEEVVNKAGDKKSVWHYFLRAQDKTKAKCIKCGRILKCEGGSTSGLQKHLKKVHGVGDGININSGQQNLDPTTIPSTSSAPPNAEEVPKKRTKLTDYYESSENPSMEVMVSRMAAVDGQPFRVFVESEDTRLLFKKAGHTLPKSANSIRNIIISEANKRKAMLIADIKRLMKEGHKFSITFDEWTSIRNRRYISLNLHSQYFPLNFKNLGLIRIYGSMPAKKCVEVIKQKLQEFAVALDKDIVAETTDGCSMMTKFGTLLESMHQKCIAHALQLAIVDVFYKEPIAPPVEIEEIDDDVPLSVYFSDLPATARNEELDTNDDSDDDDTDGAQFEEAGHTPNFEQQLVCHDLISKVKRVVKIFRKSPTKNDDVLQKYVVADFNKEYSLTSDSKTRWSSLADTLERFIKLRLCITKALLDVKSNIIFTDEDWQVIEQLYEVLDVIRTVLEALCRRDATLLTADVAIKFALKKLSTIQNSYAMKMLQMLTKRYSERRLLEASILSYLKNPENYFAGAQADDTSLFVRPTSEQMRSKIVSLLKRTNAIEARPTHTMEIDDSVDNVEIDDSVDNVDIGVQQSLKTKKEELQAELDKVAECKRQSTVVNEDLDTTVMIEMALFENGGDRGRHLTRALDHLSSIPPTSVEPERIFSAAGLLCNKIRSRLSDQSLDALLFLRSYYKEQKEIKKCK